MAVLLIVGLAMGIAIVAWPKPEMPAKTEADVLVALVGRAGQHAVVSGATVGVRVEAERVSIWQRRGGLWVPLDMGASNARNWPESVGVTVIEPAPPEKPNRDSPDGRDIGWTRDGDAPAAPPPTIRPQIVLDPTGGATPFEIVFASWDGEYRVRGDLNGTLAVEGRRNDFAF